MIDENNIESTIGQSLKCSKCKNWIILKFVRFNQTVNNIFITIDKFPVLICSECDTQYLPIKSKLNLYSMSHEAERKGYNSISLTYKENFKRYDFCNKFEFIYDSEDYEYIPGLMRDWNDGALTPVFFKKEVLAKYYDEPGYEIVYSSDTYGTIYHVSEMVLSFGINRNEKVIVWLKDLDRITENNKYHFRSYNVKSDHDIGSSFYFSQIMIGYGEMSTEKKLVKLRSEFQVLFFNKFKFRIFRTDINENKFIKRIIHQIKFNTKDFEHTINNLNKLFIECINVSDIKNHLLTRNKYNSKDLEGLRSLKSFEKFIDSNFPNCQSKILLKPFFILYDLRIISDHLMSEEEEEKKWNECMKRLNLSPDEKDYKKIYTTLIKTLLDSYQELKEKVKVTFHSKSRSI
jgi:hypothetical protein